MSLSLSYLASISCASYSLSVNKKSVLTFLVSPSSSLKSLHHLFAHLPKPLRQKVQKPQGEGRVQPTQVIHRLRTREGEDVRGAVRKPRGGAFFDLEKSTSEYVCAYCMQEKNQPNLTSQAPTLRPFHPLTSSS